MKNQKQSNGCISKCCSQFNLFGDTKEDYIKEGLEGNEESAFVGDMLILIGTDTDNPNWLVYTCKHWDSESGKCTVYEIRPQMCRDYPNGEKCEWEGCNYDPSLEKEIE